MDVLVVCVCVRASRCLSHTTSAEAAFDPGSTSLWLEDPRWIYSSANIILLVGIFMPDTFYFSNVDRTFRIIQ